MIKTYSNNSIITQNTNVTPDGYSQVFIYNLGEDHATINDNIPLPPGSQFNWTNDPGVVIDETTSIRFAGIETRKILVIKMYYK